METLGQIAAVLSMVAVLAIWAAATFAFLRGVIRAKGTPFHSAPQKGEGKANTAANVLIPYPPFNIDTPCSQCGRSTEILPNDVTWHKEGGCRENFDRRLFPGEHMHRRCRRCFFEWAEEPPVYTQ